MEFCEKTVSTMMENFIKKFSKGNGPSIEDIDAELTEVQGTISNERISNERLWQKDSDIKEQISMHEQNIRDCGEYTIRLHNLRAKRYKELKFVEKLEKSLGKDRNQMMKSITVNNDQSFTIDDDKLYMETKMPEEYGKNVYKYSLVMTKEVFQECYNRWIKPQKEDNVE